MCCNHKTSIKMKGAKTGKIEIVTDRLIIRTPEDKDVHDIFVLMSDREIAASTGFRPMSTPSEAEGKIRREMDGGLMFCISEKNLPEKVLGVFEITPHKKRTFRKRFSVFLKSLLTRQIPCRAKNAITRYVIFFIKRFVEKAI